MNTVGKVGTASVDALNVTLEQVLNRHAPLSVPRYQRGYAWEDKAVDAFIDDIQVMLDSTDPNASHFFGSAVYMQTTDESQAQRVRYEVIDGQQRLATLMLALSCVVDAAELLLDDCDGNADLETKVEEFRRVTQEETLCWTDEDVLGRTILRPRLTLSEADEELFEAIIMRTELPEDLPRESHAFLLNSRSRLRAAINLFVGEGDDLEERLARLDSYKHALVRRSHLIRIIAHQRTQAYRLFSVLNNRGKVLSIADLLRSQTMELVVDHEEQHEELAKIWDGMFAHPSKRVGEFLKAYFASRFGYRPQKQHLLDELTSNLDLNDPATTAAAAKQVVKTVKTLSSELTTYDQLARGEWPAGISKRPNKPVSDWYRGRLARVMGPVKHKLALPVLLAAARTLDEVDFGEVVYMIEVFAFRYKIISGGHAGPPGGVYVREAQLMREAAATSTKYKMTGLRNSLRELIAEKADDDRFGAGLARLTYDKPTDRAALSELLTVLEDLHPWWKRTGQKNPNSNPKPGVGVKAVVSSEISLDHIYLHNTPPAKQVPELEEVKHHLGNLALMSRQHNNDAGSASHAVKTKVHYAASDVTMTRELADTLVWDRAAVDERQSALIAMACRVFTF
ncbi:DUF262 domain-containing protein [Microbacterium sp. NPDC090225]|uniref:DUF262 domain-containing protein n=1 Tax=Microbacterium sp. NPDC090225 TaxID=3364207 RepID=UPI0038219BE3